MSNAFATSSGVEPEDGMTPASTTLTEGAREVLRRHATVPLTATELRAGLRPLVRVARESGSTIEQLLVVFKRTWAELPESRLPRGERGEGTRRLERVVTLVIETYYEA